MGGRLLFYARPGTDRAGNTRLRLYSLSTYYNDIAYRTGGARGDVFDT